MAYSAALILPSTVGAGMVGAAAAVRMRDRFLQQEVWERMGVQRIILSRELSLKEVAEIREECPDIELEVFVHGALCIAYSGRCLLSGYMSHRDSNQGACTNSCRWKYNTQEARETSTGDIVPLPSAPVETAVDELPVVLLEEETRPGELLPAYEDEHGTYIMNSKDLRAVQHVHTLAQMGIDSLKIEGRTKSFYYTARTAQVYHRAIEDAAAGKPFDMGMMDELEGLANRGYTEGFYRRHPPGEYQNYERGVSKSDRQQFVGDFVHDFGTLQRAHAPPFFLRGVSGVDRGIDTGQRAHRRQPRQRCTPEQYPNQGFCTHIT